MTTHKLQRGDALLLAEVLDKHSLRLGDEGIEQRCSRCKVYLPARDENFPPLRARVSGLASWCRNCKSEYQKAARKRDEKSSNNAGRISAQSVPSISNGLKGDH